MRIQLKGRGHVPAIVTGNEFGIKILRNMQQETDFDGITLDVAHDIFREAGLEISLDKPVNVTNERPVLINVKRYLDGSKAREKGFYCRTL